MATRGIEIPLSINPSKLIRGLRITEQQVDDLADAVENIGDEAGQVEDAFGDLSRGARRDFDRTGRAAKDAEDDVDDLADEAADSAREFGSAFRGDPVEALEEVQSLVSNIVTKAVPGIGGAVLAVTGGAAFSALIAFYDRWREEQEARRQQVIDWRDTVLDAFGVVEKAEFGQIIKDAFDEAGIAGDTLEEQIKLLPEGLRVAFRQAVQSGDLEGLKDGARRDRRER